MLTSRERKAKGTYSARIQTRSAKHILQELVDMIPPDAVLVSDSARAYKKVARALDVNLILVPPDKKHKTRGAVLINNANGYCNRLKSWLTRFRGVTTKNIPNYLAWHRVLDREGDELTAKRFLAAALA